MKQLISTLLFVGMLIGVSSGGNDLDSFDGGDHRSHNSKEKPKLKTIRMSFSGDYVSESEEPLLRADDGETFVGINVYYKEKGDEDATEQRYAYGLFKKTNGISIDLTTGYTYRFEASILTEREDKLWDHAEGRYGEPFKLSNGNSDFEKDDIGDFIYTYDSSNAKFYLRMLNNGTALVDAGDDLPSQFGDVRFPRVKRYYGNLNSFDPSLLTSVEIPMEYKCFGLKLILESIPGETSVSVSDITDNGTTITTTNHPEYYLRFPNGLRLNAGSEASKTWEGLYSLNDLNHNTKEFKLRFRWHKGQGITEDFNHTFTVEAKKKKILKINIDGEINETKSGNIVFTNLDDTLIDEEPENVTNISD
ncbi:MAG: hypothetical protein K2N35_06290 [Muribaculaceae bacterium]|nr:hypothetical protein [Muribaculaceae bacterium]